jgi:tetratricopeptide (TPR) repeat protein
VIDEVRAEHLPNTGPSSHQNSEEDAVGVDLTALFQQGLAFHQAGRLADAEAIYRHILRMSSAHFDSLHLLGVTEHQRGNHADAIRLIDLALERNPDNPWAHSNRGNALKELKRLNEALVSYDRAVTLKPDFAEAFNNRGIVLQELERLDEALASLGRAIVLKPDYAEAFYNRANVLQVLRRLDDALAGFDRAIALKPDYAGAFYNRGNVLLELGRHDEALASFERVIALKPDFAYAHNNRGNVLQELKRLDEALVSLDQAITLKPDYAAAFYNRGNVLQKLKRPSQALASFDQAIAITPDFTEALNNRGNVLRELGRLDEALACCDRALALKPDFAGALNNRGNVLQDLKHFHEALASYDRALALQPDYAEAFHNRANALKECKRLDEALASYDQAVLLKPDYADGFKNRALCRLLVGRYAEGWADFEWRWNTAEFSGRRPNFANWKGEDLAGCRLLIFAEQGLGDVIQFARYLPLLDRCQLTFLTSERLIRLLRPLTNGIEIISALGREQKFDFQCPLLSLPHRFGTELSSIPNATPYLRAEDDLIASWKNRIGSHGFKVGIAWQGNPLSRVDQGRSIPLSEYFGLARLSGVRLISLQKEDGLHQLAGLPKDVRIEMLRDVDTAAVISTLDLVITADTAIAHLAGALGRPTWVALKYVPHWPWMLDREDSPWYPMARLFRQSKPDDWASVFSIIRKELQSLAQK